MYRREFAHFNVILALFIEKKQKLSDSRDSGVQRPLTCYNVNCEVHCRSYKGSLYQIHVCTEGIKVYAILKIYNTLHIIDVNIENLFTVIC